VDLALFYREVDTLEDLLGALLGLHADVEVLYFEY